MFNRKKLAMVGAVGAMSLGLVGMGTGAQWSDQVDAIEKITTGTADLQITGYYDNYAGNEKAGSVVIAPDKDSITFTVPLEDASFAYTQDVFIRNVGSLPMKAAWYEISVAGDPELLDSAWMRVNDTSDGSDDFIGHPSALNGKKSLGYAMPAGAGTTLWFDFYTGNRTATNAIPAFVSDGLFLPDAAQGKTMTVTVTFHGVDGDGGTPMLEVPETRS
jgi:hypothetical protein